MKKLLCVYLLFVMVSFAKESPNKIGVALAISKSEYLGVGTNEPVYFPMIIYSKDRFYFKALEFGYKLLDEKYLKFALIGQAQMKNLDASDSDKLLGIKDRHRTIQSGFRATFKPMGLVSISWVNTVDTLMVHKGFSSSLGMGVFLPFSKIFVMKLSIKKTFYSKEFVDYYYGVDSDETLSLRDYYKPDSSSIKTYGVNFIFNLSKSIGFNVALAKKEYEKEIVNSPIVDEKETLSVFSALSYSF